MSLCFLNLGSYAWIFILSSVLFIQCFMVYMLVWLCKISISSQNVLKVRRACSKNFARALPLLIYSYHKKSKRTTRITCFIMNEKVMALNLTLKTAWSRVGLFLCYPKHLAMHVCASKCHCTIRHCKCAQCTAVACGYTSRSRCHSVGLGLPFAGSRFKGLKIAPEKRSLHRNSKWNGELFK